MKTSNRRATDASTQRKLYSIRLGQAKLLELAAWYVRYPGPTDLLDQIFRHQSMCPAFAARHALSPWERVRRAVAGCPALPANMLVRLLNDPEPSVRAVAQRTSEPVTRALAHLAAAGAVDD